MKRIPARGAGGGGGPGPKISLGGTVLFCYYSIAGAELVGGGGGATH